MTPIETLTAAVAAVCPITGVSSTRAIFPTPNATPEQIAAGQAIAEAFDFALETAKVDKLARWYAAKLSAGVPVGALRLKCGEADKASFSQLATMLALGIGAGAIQAADQCPTPIWDYDHTTHQLTVGEAVAVLLGYAVACSAIETQYAVNEAALASCTTVEQVNALNMESV